MEILILKLLNEKYIFSLTNCAPGLSETNVLFISWKCFAHKQLVYMQVKMAWLSAQEETCSLSENAV